MKKKRGLCLILTAAVVLAGCQKTPETSGQESLEPRETSEEELEFQEDAEEDPEEQAVSKEETTADFSFADVSNREFCFSSGAGGWYTVLHMHEDGSFDGHYQDSDMGNTGEEYPDGTMYYSDFSGAFTEPEPVDESTWKFRIDHMEYAKEFVEEVKDGIRYCYGSAYGLDGAEELYMYLPGAKLQELPAEYLSWVGYYSLTDTQETTLPFYGLYNVHEEEGFSSYVIDDPKEQVREAVSAAEEAVAALEEQLQNAQTQLEMTELSGQIYAEWDAALNTIWGVLVDTLDENSMKTLREEERRWITEKEADVSEAGAGCEGGSIQSMVMNEKQTEWTKERVYELAEYLN